MTMPIADLHCHYPMHLLAESEAKPDPGLRSIVRVRKRPRWGKLKATILLIAARAFNFRRLYDTWRVSLERLGKGEVDLVFSVLYLPDEEMDLDAWPEGSPNDGSFDELIALIDRVERDLGVNDPATEPKAVIVTAAKDLEPSSGNDTLPRFAHCIEGGFHLGSDASEFDHRVARLSARGVAYITLAHLFWRQVATNAPALPFLTDGQYRCLFPQPRGVGLNELGRAAVRAMYRHRVLIDVSHMSQAAIYDTFALLAELDDEHGMRPEDFPVIATHAGYRFGEQSYMLDEETIGAIAARDGVIGLIMAHHQLNDGLFGNRGGLKRTLATMRAHIDAIHGITGSHRHAGIGSDLDGFIKPTVGGIESAADLAKLIGPLAETYDDAADAIFRGNALRVLGKTFAEPVY
jgi:microsomal dipeptidase-like Zn-dependent dipeptidase